MAAPYKRKDHNYLQAKEQGYRSRAAYKLLELDQKYSFLKSGGKVLDLGCFPGSWLQVALKKVGKKGKVVGIDLREVEPLAGPFGDALIFLGDAADLQLQKQISDSVAGCFDVILSDMSPKISGIKFRDAVNSAELVQLAHNIAQVLLNKDGILVAKIFPGSECDSVTQQLKNSFAKVTRHSLKATRGSSKEFYILARGFYAEASQSVSCHSLSGK